MKTGRNERREETAKSHLFPQLSGAFDDPYQEDRESNDKDNVQKSVESGGGYYPQNPQNQQDY
jgi:hypothetical protein